MAKERSPGQQQPYNIATRSGHSGARTTSSRKRTRVDNEGDIPNQYHHRSTHDTGLGRLCHNGSLANNNNKYNLAAAREPQRTPQTRSRRPTRSHNTSPITHKDAVQAEECPGQSQADARKNSNKHRRRFQLRGSTLKRILSSTFKDLSLGYYLSIVMVISFKIFIFANTLNTVMGAKTFYMHWNTSNSIFRIDNTDHIIDVNKGNLAFEYDQVHIICPVYEPGTYDNETEKLIIYNVSKAEYETCRITNANPRIIAVCDKPQKLMYFTITFRPFTPSPGGLEFLPGHDYYFISTSSKDDLHRRIGGRCSTNNMKVVFKVCCGAGGSGGGPGNETPTISEGSNRTSSTGGRGYTKKVTAVTTPQPSIKIWSVPSSPAVVSHRPTINQPVVLQNDYVQSPQNHSRDSAGNSGITISSGGSHWQSSTAATKKTVKPGDFDKRANEVVKYDDLNVNEKSTTNEMVAGHAVSWHWRRPRSLLLAAALTVSGVQWRRWLY